jgi:hypothetical protein
VLARALGLGIAGLLVAASPALAGSATVNGFTLTFNAGVGEKNTLSLSYDASLNEYRFVDTTAPVSGGPGCGAIDNEIDCGAAGISAIVVYLRDGADVFTQSPLPLAPAVQGGDGNDTLSGPGILDGGAGDDSLLADPGGSTLFGGDGNDRLVGGDGDDMIDGGPGDDVISGGDGNNQLTGGDGLDRILASPLGTDTIDCQGRDDEIIRSDPADTLTGCSPAPKVTSAARRVRVARLLRRGLPFSVTCDRPCAVYWELRPDGATRRLIHHAGGWLARQLIPLDKEGFQSPVAGRQQFTAKLTGPATKKALGRLRRFGATLYVKAYARDGRSATATKPLLIG